MNDLHSPSSDQALAGKQMLARDAKASLPPPLAPEPPADGNAKTNSSPHLSWPFKGERNTTSDRQIFLGRDGVTKYCTRSLEDRQKVRENISRVTDVWPF